MESMITNLNAATPVFRLHQDVLWYIFKMNADMFSSDHGALKTTRLTSQVCAGWRDLILNSPSLWGKLMDFDAFPDGKNGWNWCKEVLRRSGNSVLWVKAMYTLDGEQDSPKVEFFYYLIKRHWNRVQKFVVRLYRDCDDHENFESLVPFIRAAPHLQFFDLTVSDAVRVGETSFLFANHAPMLCHFRLNGIKFDVPKTPWLSMLQTATLGYPLTLEDVFLAFEMMPNIESLTLEEIVDIETSGQPSNFTLPQSLRQLCLLVNINACSAILERVHVPADCSVRIDITTSQPFPPNDAEESMPQINDLLQPVSTLIQRSFRAHPPTKIFLHYSAFKFWFEDRSDPKKPLISFCWEDTYRYFPDHAVPVLFGACAFPPSLSKVVELQLDIWVNAPTSVFPAVASAFPSVEVLDASNNTNFYLSEIKGDIPCRFASLIGAFGPGEAEVV